MGLNQGFPNSSKGWGEIFPSEGGSEILLGGFFYLVKETSGVIWRFKPFSKLKTALCEYWTSIKIKINMPVCPKSMQLK